MVSRAKTESKTWIYRFEATPYGVRHVLGELAYGGSEPEGNTEIMDGEEWRPFYGSNSDDEVRSFRFTFEGRDSRIRSMLKAAALANRHFQNYEYEHEGHDRFESFGLQMKEQGFPRPSV